MEQLDDESIMNWVTVCHESDLVTNVGICVLLADKQVAIFKTEGDEIYAIDNYDPFSKVNVLSRGVCGDMNGKPMVASPIYKQHFSLATGVCFEDDSVSISVYQVRNNDGQIELAV